MQARKKAAAVEDSLRFARLQAQAGSSMVTMRSTFASLDEDGDGADAPAEELRLNLILKV